MKLAAHERELIGKWLTSANGLTKDSVAERIDALVAHHLVELGTDSSGWDVLFHDPTDGRLWELTYPESELPGGGPPRLACISVDAAQKKYGPVV
jgi:hypothetical protein